MNYLPFVLWLLLFPLTCSISIYLDVLTRKMLNFKTENESEYRTTSGINFFIYAFLAIIIFVLTKQ